MTQSGQLVVRYDRLVVKNGVHAAGNWAYAPQLAVFKLRCSQNLWVPSLETASWGAHTQFTFQKHPCLGPQLTPSGDLLRDFFNFSLALPWL